MDQSTPAHDLPIFKSYFEISLPLLETPKVQLASVYSGFPFFLFSLLWKTNTAGPDFKVSLRDFKNIRSSTLQFHVCTIIAF